ncbi:MAG TPA: fused MFS/spermidine synthase [Chthoniobacterales bacterium]|nr:fused MFS/spermidine synthase [Chthoniobacterales bacterium]
MAPALFVLVFLLGMLSMGLQLVASRVLAPFFGNSIFVWASLITTFLAAFSTGSFIGAAVSSRSTSQQRRIVAILMIVCAVTLLFNSLASARVCDWLDLHIENLATKLILACVLLYFVPVMSLSSITPVCIAWYDRREKAAGRSAGLLNGVSTLGNIVGVLVAAFVLIPTFGTRILLHVWWIASVAIQFFLWSVLFSRSQSPVSAPNEFPRK